jgi:hypothetical protein
VLTKKFRLEGVAIVELELKLSAQLQLKFYYGNAVYAEFLGQHVPDRGTGVQSLGLFHKLPPERVLICRGPVCQCPLKPIVRTAPIDQWFNLHNLQQWNR